MPELVEAFRQPRSTVIRILATLEEYGLVERKGRLVRLSDRFYLWAAKDRYALLKIKYRPVLRDVLESVRELVLLGVPEGRSIVHLDYLEWDHQVRVAPIRETRHALECTAMGKLLLAQRPDLIAADAPAALREEIAEAHRSGVGWNREEENAGVVVVATHGFSRALSEPVVAVAWPKVRFTEEKAERAIAAIRDALARHARAI